MYEKESIYPYIFFYGIGIFIYATLYNAYIGNKQ